MDPLFERLRTTTDEAEAMALELQVLHIWFESDNPLVSDLLGSGLAAMARGDYPIAHQHDFRLLEVVGGLGGGGSAQKLECRRCGQVTTRAG